MQYSTQMGEKQQPRSLYKQSILLGAWTEILHSVLSLLSHLIIIKTF
jgi:hypothetical protein